MDALAQEYVRLVLAVGRHDADYVDAYYGSPEWRESADAPLTEIRSRAEAARAGLDEAAPRGRFLAKQLDALVGRVRMLAGERLGFDEESAALYDVVAPSYPDAQYAETVARLEAILPGEGPVGERFEVLRKRFYVPADRLAAVFDAAIAAARERTKRHLALPEGESFRTEYVADRVWGAYQLVRG